MTCIECGESQPRPGEVLCIDCLVDADDPCACGHGLRVHYRDTEDQGCAACNHTRITTGEGTLCRRYLSVTRA